MRSVGRRRLPLCPAQAIDVQAKWAIEFVPQFFLVP
jgi:hypothetical protein